MHIDRHRRTVRGGGRISLVLLLAAMVPSASCRTETVARPTATPLRIAFGVPETAKLSGVRLLTDLLYNEPLISHDSSGRPWPALAESWRWDDGGRLLRLRVREGVQFHDGTPLTAPLAVRALEANRGARAPALGFQYVTSIEAPADLDIVIRLSQPDVFLLTALNEVRISHPDNPDVGTGPFELVRRAPVVETKRFANYHGGLPGSSEVRITTYESQRAAWAALMRGEADVAQEISREAVDFMERTSQIRTYSSPQPFYIPLVFNHGREGLSDVRVRRALSLAINRARIVERAMRGRGIVAESPIWRAHWAYEPSETPSPYDPRAAVDLLERAGYPMKPASPGSPAHRLSFRCLFINEDQQFERIALMVQRQLFDIGVHLELVPLTLLDLARRASAGDFDIFLASANAGRSLMFTHLFWRSPALGQVPIWRTGYTGVDAPLDRLRASTSDAELREALRGLSGQFERDVPAVFIAWTEVTRAVTADIAVGVEPGTDPFMSIWKWQRTAGERPQ